MAKMSNEIIAAASARPMTPMPPRSRKARFLLNTSDVESDYNSTPQTKKKKRRSTSGCEGPSAACSPCLHKATPYPKKVNPFVKMIKKKLSMSGHKPKDLNSSQYLDISSRQIGEDDLTYVDDDLTFVEDCSIRNMTVVLNAKDIDDSPEEKEFKTVMDLSLPEAASVELSDYLTKIMTGEDDEDEDKSRFPDSDYNLLQLIDDQREENQVLQDENTELKRQQSLMLSRHEEDTIKNDDIRNKLEAEAANLKNKLEVKDLGYANLESELTLVRSVEVPRHLSEIVRLRFQNCEMTKAHQELTQEVEALKIEKEETASKMAQLEEQLKAKQKDLDKCLGKIRKKMRTSSLTLLPTTQAAATVEVSAPWLRKPKLPQAEKRQTTVPQPFSFLIREEAKRAARLEELKKAQLLAEPKNKTMPRK